MLLLFPRHYLFFDVQSFPWALLLDNCLILGTNNVQGKISKQIFVLNGFCLYKINTIVCWIPYFFFNSIEQNSLRWFIVLLITLTFQTNFPWLPPHMANQWIGTNLQNYIIISCLQLWEINSPKKRWYIDTLLTLYLHVQLQELWSCAWLYNITMSFNLSVHWTVCSWTTNKKSRNSTGLKSLDDEYLPLRAMNTP